MPQRKKSRRTPNQSRSRATVDAIVEGLAQVLERDGWEEVTTATIAERAGVSVGTLYQYFADREAVLDALVERLMQEQIGVLIQVTTQLSSEQPPPSEAVERVLDAILAAVGVRPLLLRRVLTEVPRSRYQDLDSVWKQRCVQVVQAALYQAPREERLDRNLDVVATITVGLMFGVVRDVVAYRPELLGTPALREELMLLMHRYLAQA